MECNRATSTTEALTPSRHLDIFDQINVAVERNDRTLLHQQFTRLILLQDSFAHEERHTHTLRHAMMREDGIDWPINECSTCDWWVRSMRWAKCESTHEYPIDEGG